MKIKKELKKPKTRFADQYHLIDTKKLLSVLRYDETSGRLYRRYAKDNWKIIKRKEHSVPGYVFHFMHKSVSVHDAVWLIHHGHWPKDVLIAMDGDLCNTKIDNLIYKSETQEQLGQYRLWFADPINMIWEAYVWHHPFFAKKSRFRNKLGAEAWAKAELRMYNRYAVGTEALAKNNSEENKIPVPGIYNFPGLKLYEVRVRKTDGLWYYHCLTKTIEDAIEAQRIGQAEIDEVWGLIERMDEDGNELTLNGKIKRNYLAEWRAKTKKEEEERNG